jgi:hypothetical protein
VLLRNKRTPCTIDEPGGRCANSGKNVVLYDPTYSTTRVGLARNLGKKVFPLSIRYEISGRKDRYPKRQPNVREPTTLLLGKVTRVLVKEHQLFRCDVSVNTNK